MSDLTKKDKDLIWASGHYLTENFPEEFTEWEEEDHEFIDEHISERYEFSEPNYIYEEIDNLEEFEYKKNIKYECRKKNDYR